MPSSLANGTTSVTLHIADYPQLTVLVSRIFDPVQTQSHNCFSTADRLWVTANVTTLPTNVSDDFVITYQWWIEFLPSTLNLSDPVVSPTGPSQSFLIVYPNQLAVGLMMMPHQRVPDAVVMVNATITFRNHSLWGIGRMDLCVDHPPVGGTLSTTAATLLNDSRNNSTLQTGDLMRVSAPGWWDDTNGLLSYQFYYGSRGTNQMVWKPFAESIPFSIGLPIPYLDVTAPLLSLSQCVANLPVRVMVTDPLGSQSSVFTTIPQICPPTNLTLETLIGNALETAKNQTGTQQLDTLLDVINIIGMSNLTNSSNSLVEQLHQAILNASAPNTTHDLESQTSAIRIISELQSVDINDTSLLDVISQALNATLNSSSSSSLGCTLQIVTDIITAMANLLTAYANVTATLNTPASFHPSWAIPTFPIASASLLNSSSSWVVPANVKYIRQVLAQAARCLRRDWIPTDSAIIDGGNQRIVLSTARLARTSIEQNVDTGIWLNGLLSLSLKSASGAQPQQNASLDIQFPNQWTKSNADPIPAVVDVELFLFGVSPYFVTPAMGPLAALSVVDVPISLSSVNSTSAVVGNANAVMLRFKMNPSSVLSDVPSTSSTYSPACLYYNENSTTWSTGGVHSAMVPPSSSDSFAIECRTSHLTDFTVVLFAAPIPTPPSPSPIAPSAAVTSASSFSVWEFFCFPCIVFIFAGAYVLAMTLAMLRECIHLPPYLKTVPSVLHPFLQSKLVTHCCHIGLFVPTRAMHPTLAIPRHVTISFAAMFTCFALMLLYALRTPSVLVDWDLVLQSLLPPFVAFIGTFLPSVIFRYTPRWSFSALVLEWRSRVQKFIHQRRTSVAVVPVVEANGPTPKMAWMDPPTQIPDQSDDGVPKQAADDVVVGDGRPTMYLWSQLNGSAAAMPSNFGDEIATVGLCRKANGATGLGVTAQTSNCLPLHPPPPLTPSSAPTRLLGRPECLSPSMVGRYYTSLAHQHRRTNNMSPSYKTSATGYFLSATTTTEDDDNCNEPSRNADGGDGDCPSAAAMWPQIRDHPDDSDAGAEYQRARQGEGERVDGMGIADRPYCVGAQQQLGGAQAPLDSTSELNTIDAGNKPFSYAHLQNAIIPSKSVSSNQQLSSSIASQRPIQPIDAAVLAFTEHRTGTPATIITQSPSSHSYQRGHNSSPHSPAASFSHIQWASRRAKSLKPTLTATLVSSSPSHTTTSIPELPEFHSVSRNRFRDYLVSSAGSSSPTSAPVPQQRFSGEASFGAAHWAQHPIATTLSMIHGGDPMRTMAASHGNRLFLRSAEELRFTDFGLPKPKPNHFPHQSSQALSTTTRLAQWLGSTDKSSADHHAATVTLSRSLSASRLSERKTQRRPKGAGPKSSPSLVLDSSTQTLGQSEVSPSRQFVVTQAPPLPQCPPPAPYLSGVDWPCATTEEGSTSFLTAGATAKWRSLSMPVPSMMDYSHGQDQGSMWSVMTGPRRRRQAPPEPTPEPWSIPRHTATPAQAQADCSVLWPLDVEHNHADTHVTAAMAELQETQRPKTRKGEPSNTNSNANRKRENSALWPLDEERSLQPFSLKAERLVTNEQRGLDRNSVISPGRVIWPSEASTEAEPLPPPGKPGSSNSAAKVISSAVGTHREWSALVHSVPPPLPPPPPMDECSEKMKYSLSSSSSSMLRLRSLQRKGESGHSASIRSSVLDLGLTGAAASKTFEASGVIMANTAKPKGLCAGTMTVSSWDRLRVADEQYLSAPIIPIPGTSVELRECALWSSPQDAMTKEFVQAPPVPPADDIAPPVDQQSMMAPTPNITEPPCCSLPDAQMAMVVQPNGWGTFTTNLHNQFGVDPKQSPNNTIATKTMSAGLQDLQQTISDREIIPYEPISKIVRESMSRPPPLFNLDGVPMTSTVVFGYTGDTSTTSTSTSTSSGSSPRAPPMICNLRDVVPPKTSPVTKQQNVVENVDQNKTPSPLPGSASIVMVDPKAGCGILGDVANEPLHLGLTNWRGSPSKPSHMFCWIVVHWFVPHAFPWLLVAYLCYWVWMGGWLAAMWFALASIDSPTATVVWRWLIGSALSVAVDLLVVQPLSAVFWFAIQRHIGRIGLQLLLQPQQRQRPPSPPSPISPPSSPPRVNVPNEDEITGKGDGSNKTEGDGLPLQAETVPGAVSVADHQQRHKNCEAIALDTSFG